MERITIFDTSKPQIGLFVRNATRGEEYNMVLNFIDYYCRLFLRNNKRNNLAVFIEPKIASGFPDIVFASYSPQIVDSWTQQRQKLTTNELKVLSYLLQTGGLSGEEIISALQIPEKQTIVSLEKLMDANLASYKRSLWRAKGKSTVCSITKLVSVEAKMGDMSRVLGQAFLNTWFASHSFALISSSKPQPETVDMFFRHGIGLYCKGNIFRKVTDAKRQIFPLSYQSLMFNEWIGNALSTNK